MKIHGWKVSMWKSAAYRTAPGKWKQIKTIMSGQNLAHWPHRILERMWNNRHSPSLLQERKTIQPGCKTVRRSLAKLNKFFQYNPATLLLGIYPKELKSYVHRKSCTQMFIAALFMFDKPAKQRGCPSSWRGEWRGAMQYLQTTGCWILSRHEPPTRKRHGGTITACD